MHGLSPRRGPRVAAAASKLAMLLLAVGQCRRAHGLSLRWVLALGGGRRVAWIRGSCCAETGQWGARGGVVCEKSCEPAEILRIERLNGA